MTTTGKPVLLFCLSLKELLFLSIPTLTYSDHQRHIKSSVYEFRSIATVSANRLKTELPQRDYFVHNYSK